MEDWEDNLGTCTTLTLALYIDVTVVWLSLLVGRLAGRTEAVPDPFADFWEHIPHIRLP